MPGRPLPSPARRRCLKTLAAAGAATLAGPLPSFAQSSDAVSFGDGELLLLGDGTMSLPVGFVLPDGVPADERAALMREAGIAGDTYAQPVTVTLWRSSDRVVLFDAGAGPAFLDGTGQLYDSLALAGIDPSDVTDVVLTHAHPDHLWGVLDDFDELVFNEATYYIDAREHDYWLADDTLSNTPEARQSFVVGAQNRLPLIEDRLRRFAPGDEVLPGIEAVDTRGHTPGHTSFVLHADGDAPLMVLGDALINPVLSFAHPTVPSGSDQDPEQAVRTRLSLLDRLAAEDLRAIGYHLPTPGLGRVERNGAVYRWVPAA